MKQKTPEIHMKFLKMTKMRNSSELIYFISALACQLIIIRMRQQAFLTVSVAVEFKIFPFRFEVQDEVGRVCCVISFKRSRNNDYWLHSHLLSDFESPLNDSSFQIELNLIYREAGNLEQTT